MINGHDNPNNVPDEDWAMSEPEIPVKKEIEAKPIDEAAASLYAPLDTGDLEGWDIASQDVSSSDDPVSPPNSPPPEFNEPVAFTPPPNSFEVLKPVASPKSPGDDWGMNKSNAKNDDWKMPDPTFRATEGEILTKIRKSSSKPKPAASAQAQEILPDIYAPPDTQESITEDFDLSDTQKDIELSEALPAESQISPQMPEEFAVTPISNKSSYLVWVLLSVGLLAVILSVVGVVLYFYGGTIKNNFIN